MKGNEWHHQKQSASMAAPQRHLQKQITCNSWTEIAYIKKKKKKKKIEYKDTGDHQVAVDKSFMWDDHREVLLWLELLAHGNLRGGRGSVRQRCWLFQAVPLVIIRGKEFCPSLSCFRDRKAMGETAGLISICTTPYQSDLPTGSWFKLLVVLHLC